MCVIPRCVRIRLRGRREWWWGNAANWKDAEKHWRSELKEQGLECNRCQSTGDLVSGKLRCILKRHVKQKQLLLCNQSEWQLHLQKSNTTCLNTVCVQRTSTSQSPVNTERHSRLKSQLEGKKSPYSTAPHTFPHLQTVALKFFICSQGGEFETQLQRQLCAAV